MPRGSPPGNGVPSSTQTGVSVGLPLIYAAVVSRDTIGRYTGKRFGARRRPYTTHTAKSVSTGVMKELARVWHAELTVTASHPFRGMREGHSDVYVMFLFSHFLVERWREGLLWSWAVGKIGGLDDRWGPAERARAWGDVGGRSGARGVRVVTTARTTVDEEVVRGNLHAAGHAMSGKTGYAFGGLVPGDTPPPSAYIP